MRDRVYAWWVRILLLLIAALAIPSAALAKPKPKIAVAPLAGDAGNKIAQAVVDALAGKDFAVVGPKETKRELGKIGAPEELDAKDVRKLAQRMGVVAIIDGKVGKAGKKRSLRLEIHRRGKPSAGFTIEFKSASSEGFRKGVRKTVLEKLDGATEDTDEEERPVAQKPADDDKRSRDDERARDDDKRSRDDERARDDDKRASRDDKRAREDDKRTRDDDAPRKGKKDVAEREPEEGEERAVRKRKSRQGDDERAPLVVARVGAGPSVAQRRLSYSTRGGFTQIPPPVTTTAAGARIAGELYPFAFGGGGSSGGAAGFGLAASYDKSFGLKIQVPGQAVSAPIDQSHYAVGARYRFAVGQASSIALGVDYAKRTYIADRSALMAANLDTPDFDYTAVAPGAEARAPVSGAIALFAHVDGMLMLETGPVTKNTAYGAATVYGVEAQAGFDVALAKQISLRIAAEYSQMSFSFSNKGMLAINRDNDPATQDVMGAVDRYIGAAATLELVY